MATPSYQRSIVGSVKRLKLSSSTPPPTQHSRRSIQSTSRSSATALPSNLERELATLRLPKAVQATYLAPLRREPESKSHPPVAQLQLRSYNVRNLELFTDFALRAAYFLKLAVSGSSPLPKITERWTVPRSNFVHKKSQENFERITMRRKITVKEGHPETVAIWLAFLRKHQYYGVGLKADVWENGSLNHRKEEKEEMSKIGEMLGGLTLPDRLANSRVLMDASVKGAYGALGPMGGAESVPYSGTQMGQRISKRELQGKYQKARKALDDTAKEEISLALWKIPEDEWNEYCRAAIREKHDVAKMESARGKLRALREQYGTKKQWVPWTEWRQTLEEISNEPKWLEKRAKWPANSVFEAEKGEEAAEAGKAEAAKA